MHVASTAAVHGGLGSRVEPLGHDVPRCAMTVMSLFYENHFRLTRQLRKLPGASCRRCPFGTVPERTPSPPLSAAPARPSAHARTVFLHSFAGAGRLSHYIAAGGQPVISIDTLVEPHFNILDYEIFRSPVSWAPHGIEGCNSLSHVQNA